MLKSGVDAIPVKLWEWGIRNCSGALRTYPKETIRLALMPKEKGSVTEKGVYFRKLYYTCREAREGQWFEKARKNGRYPVDVSYDPRDMNVIYVWEKDGDGAVPCTLLDWEQRFSGKSLEEVEYEQAKQALRIKEHERSDREGAMNLTRYINAIVDDAERMAPPVKGKSKKERLADIRENRKEEKESLREEESFTAAGSPKTRKTSGGKDTDTRGAATDPFAMTEEQWEQLSPIERMLWEDVKGRRNDGSLDSKS